MHKRVLASPRVCMDVCLHERVHARTCACTYDMGCFQPKMTSNSSPSIRTRSTTDNLHLSRQIGRVKSRPVLPAGYIFIPSVTVCQACAATKSASKSPPRNPGVLPAGYIFIPSSCQACAILGGGGSGGGHGRLRASASSHANSRRNPRIPRLHFVLSYSESAAAWRAFTRSS